jgi:hypothetical protein
VRRGFICPEEEDRTVEKKTKTGSGDFKTSVFQVNFWSSCLPSLGLAQIAHRCLGR